MEKEDRGINGDFSSSSTYCGCLRWELRGSVLSDWAWVLSIL